MVTDIVERVKEIFSLMDVVLSDRSIPKNVRKIVEDGKSRMNDKAENLSVSLSTTIYELDEAVNDINIPMHARSEIWGIISALEKLKEETK